MMKNFLFTNRKGVAAMMMVALFCLLGVNRASAQTSTIVPVQLEQEFTITEANNFDIFSITVPEDGTLLLYYYFDKNFRFDLAHTGASVLYSNAECTVGVPLLGSPTETNTYFIYRFKVEKGKTYYFTRREKQFLMETEKFMFTMTNKEISPELTLIYPQCGENTYFNWLSGFDSLQLLFSVNNVKCDGIFMQYEDNAGDTKELQLDYTIMEWDQSWRIQVYQGVQSVKDQIKDGSLFYVVLKNVTANGVAVSGDWAKDGNIELPYLYRPVTISTSAVWPNPFISYWPEGDSAGMAVITFDNPLAPLDKQPSGSMQDGSRVGAFSYSLHEGDDYENESGFRPMTSPKVTIDGNTLTLDFTGVQRSCEKEVVTMIVQNLVDANGNMILYNDGYQLAAQIWVVLPWEGLKPIDLAYELTPGDDANIANVDEIELWISNESLAHIQIDGFEFTSGSLSEVVSIEACRQIPDEFDPLNYTLIYIPVPEIAKGGDTVKMSAQLLSLDGSDYAIEATYYGNNGVQLNAVEKADVIYNLQGVKVNGKNLPAGIYIKNGKKVVIR